MTDAWDFDALLEIVDAATPGPWERGDRYHVAGVGFGNAPGKCAYCARYTEPVWVGERDINGRMMRAHIHKSATPWHELGIYSARDDDPTIVVVETDEYGTLTDADAAYLTTFDPITMRRLIELLQQK